MLGLEVGCKVISTRETAIRNLRHIAGRIGIASILRVTRVPGPILPSIVSILLVSLSAITANGQETYVFERMWPTLQQPWYFNAITGIAVDDSGTTFVADWLDSEIKVFSGDGHQLRNWTSNTGIDICIGPDGLLYVAAFNAQRIDVYTKEGTLVGGWETRQGGVGNLMAPGSIDATTTGDLIVSCTSSSGASLDDFKI